MEAWGQMSRLVNAGDRRGASASPASRERRPEVNSTEVTPRGPGSPRGGTDSRSDALKGVEEHLASLLAPGSFEAEQYRALRHGVEEMRNTRVMAVVAVSSPGVGEGKTTTAINLAGALAQAPQARVLLMDADLRCSAVGARLGLSDAGGPGLVDAILDPGLTLDDVVRWHPRFNLSVLPPGRCSAPPYEVLNSPRLGTLLEEARRQYDYVVLDTPPLLPVADSRLIARWVDGFLVVVAAHQTPRELLEEALNLMDSAKLVGLVFNGDDRPPSRYYARY